MFSFFPVRVVVVAVVFIVVVVTGAAFFVDGSSFRAKESVGDADKDEQNGDADDNDDGQDFDRHGKDALARVFYRRFRRRHSRGGR